MTDTVIKLKPLLNDEWLWWFTKLSIMGLCLLDYYCILLRVVMKQFSQAGWSHNCERSNRPSPLRGPGWCQDCCMVRRAQHGCIGTFEIRTENVRCAWVISALIKKQRTGRLQNFCLGGLQHSTRTSKWTSLITPVLSRNSFGLTNNPLHMHGCETQLSRRHQKTFFKWSQIRFSYFCYNTDG